MHSTIFVQIPVTVPQKHAGNVSQCARAAGIDRRNFQRLLRRHNLGSAPQKTDKE